MGATRKYSTACVTAAASAKSSWFVRADTYSPMMPASSVRGPSPVVQFWSIVHFNDGLSTNWFCAVRNAPAVRFKLECWGQRKNCTALCVAVVLAAWPWLVSSTPSIADTALTMRTLEAPDPAAVSVSAIDLLTNIAPGRSS